MIEQSQEYIEKAGILELERVNIELRHKYKMEELNLEREMRLEEHYNRMSEIRLKNKNVQRTIDENRKIREQGKTKDEHEH